MIAFVAFSTGYQRNTDDFKIFNNIRVFMKFIIKRTFFHAAEFFLQSRKKTPQ